MLEHNKIVIMLKQLCFAGLAFKQWLESAAVGLHWYVPTTSFSSILEFSCLVGRRLFVSHFLLHLLIKRYPTRKFDRRSKPRGRMGSQG